MKAAILPLFALFEPKALISKHSIANMTVELVREHGLSLISNFTVIEPGRARIRKMTGNLDG